MNKWERILAKSGNPPMYAGMTAREEQGIERQLDRQVRAKQRLWARTKTIVSYDPVPEVQNFTLYDDQGEAIGSGRWTRDIAYSLAAEYGWTIKTERPR